MAPAWKPSYCTKTLTFFFLYSSQSMMYLRRVAVDVDAEKKRRRGRTDLAPVPRMDRIRAPFFCMRAWRFASSSAGRPSCFFVGSGVGSCGDLRARRASAARSTAERPSPATHPSRGSMKPAGATLASPGDT